jgi:nitrogenase molybdenum-iron protein alpha/beta subunit
MCKFFTVYYVISVIRYVIPLVPCPTGCPIYISDFVKTREFCEIRGVPLEPLACTSLDESHVIHGGRGMLWMRLSLWLSLLPLCISTYVLII